MIFVFMCSVTSSSQLRFNPHNEFWVYSCVNKNSNWMKILINWTRWAADVIARLVILSVVKSKLSVLLLNVSPVCSTSIQAQKCVFETRTQDRYITVLTH